ncbi:MAG: DUF1028 domain-containing protein [Candidatus Marinimicrobia bacterium]|jgi:uncharacterized Ntn-hydrolase superfamily protein|nr:DUF1028 domain-containing protein [Candidatus Neomarinimicrobiota bacterium]MBT5439773.1 DUF1028 domain-containing protein [Candidatus Neomarinimicrobiota bacterium]
MKRLIVKCFFFVTITLSQNISENRPISTYSIVALDAETGELGVAVQSHWFSVGFLVPWVKAGVGAVATQSFVKVDYGPDGLELMENGMSAKDALKSLTDQDEAEAVRQVAMIDINGNVAAHTGERCIVFANHVVGKNYSVQANMMENSTVPKAMAVAFENSSGDLADRMMAALEAAEKEGGDIRGKQSAAMVIMSGEPTGIEWKDTKMSLRIEDHPTPLKELKRLIRIHRAYQHANKGDYYMELNQIDNALTEYNKASKYYPENPELPYWSAVALVNGGRINEALPIFKAVFKSNPNLKKMTPRLIKSGLLIDDEKVLKKIMMQ